MKTSEIGKYYLLIDDDIDHKICFSNQEIIGIFDHTKGRYDKEIQMTEYDTVLYIHILNDCAELAVMHTKNKTDNINPQKIYIDKPIEFLGHKYLLKYEFDDDFLEDAFVAFKDEALEGYYNIKCLLVKYAKKIGISGTQAIGHVVTKIDVPEVEGQNM